MEQLKIKHDQLLTALERLEEIIAHSKENNLNELTPSSEWAHTVIRDSMIKRFEFCIDLFWKYLKKFLEAEGLDVTINAPKPIIRLACNAHRISEEESELCLLMIQSRNTTAHQYAEEMAEFYAGKIPSFQITMKKIATRLTPQSAGTIQS